jgi:hypothetical protein
MLRFQIAIKFRAGVDSPVYEPLDGSRRYENEFAGLIHQQLPTTKAHEPEREQIKTCWRRREKLGRMENARHIVF